MKIAIILAQFGSLPNYFNLWLESAGENPFIDFYVISDMNFQEYHVPANVSIVKESLDGIQQRLNIAGGGNLKLNRAYKLSDYKPLFGLAYQDILQNYDFWGHVDPDIIFGNLSLFLTPEILNTYDRIYTRGHLSLYRNNTFMNHMFELSNMCSPKDFFRFKEVKRSNQIFAFDEWGYNFGYGISKVIEDNGIPQYDGIDFADISVNSFSFELAETGEAIENLKYESGNLSGLANGLKRSFVYVHLQKREMRVEEGIKNSFYIKPNRFSLSSSTNDNDFSEWHKRGTRRIVRTKISRLNPQWILLRIKHASFGYK
ncbi:MAG: DUF6625 family protein [Oenococcus sp.]|uniref:DUF6625 family protein n=1 Tax=Oenococcus sp. TaxID=1979414 RepID=UPI0039E7BBD3